MNKEIVQLREVISKLVPLLAGKHIKVTQRGAEARVTVDPRTRKPIEVNIPSISDNATPEFVRAIQGFVDHEVGHVLITDWTVYSNYEKTAPNKRKAQRIEGFHNIVEDTFVEREYTKIYPGSRRHLTELRTHFLERVTKVALKDAKSEKEQFQYLLVPLVRALSGQTEFVDFMDDGKYWKNPFVEELMNKMKPETLKAIPRLSSTRHTLMVAREIDNILYPNESDQDEMDEESDSSGQGKKPHTKNSKKASGGKSGKGQSTSGSDKDGEDEGRGKGGSSSKSKPSEKKEEKSEEESDAGQGAEEEKSEDEKSEDEQGGKGEEKNDEKENGGSEKSDEESEDGEEKSKKSGDADESGEDEEDEDGESYSVEVENDGDHDLDGGSEDHENKGDGGGVGGGIAKSMFDFKDDAFEKADLAKQISVNLTKDAIEAMNKSDYNVFSRESDKIEPLQVPDTLSPKFIPRIDDQAGRMVGKMQKDIERMMAAQAMSVRVPGHRSGRLQSSSLHRIMSNDDRVFNRKHENRTKATAVTLLIDNSGSMSGAKVETAMVAAYALAQTMERIGIPCEMLGFTTGGYAYHGSKMTTEDAKVRYDRNCALIMPIYKAFDERVNSVVKGRIAHMAYNQPGMNANVDGECLEYAAARLMQRKEPRKVMIVLSDGQPAGANNAAGHLKRTVMDLSKAGLDIVGIGIMDNSVKHFYPKHMVLNNVEDLPGIVMGELKRVLTA